MAEESAQPKFKKVRLVWADPSATVVANQAVVQYDGNLAYVTFGHAPPPIILAETEEEKQQQVDKIESLTVVPVIRIAMSPESFRSVAEAFQKQLPLIEAMNKSKAEPP